MDYLVYLIFRVIVAFLQVLPEKAAYALGRGLLSLLRVMRVQVPMVRKNLQICFPELSNQERERILKKHYRYLGEMLVETARLGSMNRQEASSRLQYDSHCHPDSLDAELQSVICWQGHFGCFDFGSIIAQSCSVAYFYKAVRNNYMNKWLKSLRERWGCTMIEASESREAIRKSKENDNGWLFMISDQRPGKNLYDCNFFGQKIPFAVGPEVFSRRLKKKMVYARMERVKPGYYRLSMQKLDDAESHPGSITQQAVSLLEADIRKNPEYYTWTYNRFPNTNL